MAHTEKMMVGKTCMVTGANTGIGKATALGLAKKGGTVVMACRNRERGEAALTEIKRESGNDEVSLLVADLSSLASIRQLAGQFKAKYPTLHVLVNNAGLIPKKRTVTEDGLETQFVVNHLAYFLITNLMLDTIKASAPARIVNVSSTAHKYGSIDFDDLQSERSYRRGYVYYWTKLANVLFTYELARRLEGTNVTANCLHPGAVATNLLADYMLKPFRFVARIVGVSPEKGAQTPLYLATSPEVEGVSGKYFDNRKAVPSSEASYDKNTASRLWRVSAELTGLPESA